MNQPQAPDPYQTAAAQTQSNQQTAAYQASLNNTNQITPYGSVKYDQTGTASNGAPQYTATTSLSQPVQNLVDSNLANNQAESGLEGQLAGSAASTISQPLNLSPSALQMQMDKQNAVTLDPQWARNDETAQQNAYNQGLAPGSAAWSAEMQNEGTLKNQAYNQAYVADQGAAQNALTAQYEAPLNALNALKSGSQMSQPGVGQTAATTQTPVAGTNVAGIVEQNYQNQVAQSNAAMGGLFGLGSAGLGMFRFNPITLSDRRVKKEISRIGARADGIPLYSWKYIWGGPLRIGPMAQDVQHLYPDAVLDVGGYLAIDFGRMP